jgi:hypothetical protein
VVGSTFMQDAGAVSFLFDFRSACSSTLCVRNAGGEETDHNLCVDGKCYDAESDPFARRIWGLICVAPSLFSLMLDADLRRTVPASRHVAMYKEKALRRTFDGI